MGLSAHQLRMAEIMAKCSGSLSILGSTSIVLDILFLRRRKQSSSSSSTTRRKQQTTTTLLQILLGMSLFDIGASSMYIWGSWAIPPHSSNDDNTTDDNNVHDVFQPSGTNATCHAQGFLFQTFASAIPMYNLSLAIYSYLAVNWDWKETQFQSYHWCFHILPISFGTITATYGLLHDQFNPNELWCWFSGTKHSDMLKFVVYYGPLWIVFFVILTLFGLMYRHVHEREETNKRIQLEQILVAIRDNNNSLHTRPTQNDNIHHHHHPTNDSMSTTTTTNTTTPTGINQHRHPLCASGETTTATSITHDCNNTTTSTTTNSVLLSPTLDPLPSLPDVTTEAGTATTRTASTTTTSHVRYSFSVEEIAHAQEQMQQRQQRSATVNVNLSRFVFIQGFQFACVFILTFVFPTLVRSQQLHKDQVRFPLIFCMTLFLPLQGFFNSLVYFKVELRQLLCQIILWKHQIVSSWINASSILGWRSSSQGRPYSSSRSNTIISHGNSVLTGRSTTQVNSTLQVDAGGAGGLTTTTESFMTTTTTAAAAATTTTQMLMVCSQSFTPPVDNEESLVVSSSSSSSQEDERMDE